MELRPLCGSEEFMARALDAVKQWRFRPTILNGRPVEVQTTVRLYL